MNEFFRCITCHKNICNLCKPRHEPKHNIIKYDHKNYICQLHNEKLIKYCKDCNTNICSVCDGHDEHKKVDFEDLIPNIEEKKNILNKMKTMIDSIDSIDIRIKEIINILNEVSDFMKKFYDICNNIVSNYDEKRNNYQILQNLIEISTNNIIYNKLKEIDLNIKDNINDIFDLYNNIHIKEKENKIEDIKEIEKDNVTDEITIIYNSLNQDIIEIFSNDFVSNYKTKCNIIIDNKKESLSTSLHLNPLQQKEKTIEIKLQGIKNITHTNYMFKNCNSLITIPDIFNWDTKIICDMKGMFSNCMSLKSLPNISYLNTERVYDMSYMFYDCVSLISLPDISNWNTKNVSNMAGMFYGCKSLKSLPDISKWDTKRVSNMNRMFYNCSSLITLPDISKWDINKVNDMRYIFSGCSSLKSFPDISVWKIHKELKKEGMFEGLNKKIIPKKYKGCYIY